MSRVHTADMTASTGPSLARHIPPAWPVQAVTTAAAAAVSSTTAASNQNQIKLISQPGQFLQYLQYLRYELINPSKYEYFRHQFLRYLRTNPPPL